MSQVCESGWEALTGDPLPWLLEGNRPGLHWRVLTEMVQRPYESPAVRRARSGANAGEPVATLLADLLPDGSWASPVQPWTAYAGCGWRLLAAVQLGADPDDPRLQTGIERLATSIHEGGLARRPGEPPCARLTARVAEALAALGWCRHARLHEYLAWLEDGADKSWDEVTATAVLSALAFCDDAKRPRLYRRAAERLLVLLEDRSLGRGPRDGYKLGHPNLLRTDIAEMLSVLRRCNHPYDPRMRPALSKLQVVQVDGGRWLRSVDAPDSLPLGGARQPAGKESRWLTLRAASVLLHYAEAAGLPRLFPMPPGADPRSRPS
jgi:hypothetical protein